jgi:hypothetical protein
MSDRKMPEWLRIAREDNWDSYQGRKTTDAAIKTAEHLTSCPTSCGGIQIELHAGGSSVEIEINDDGRMVGVVWSKR